MRNERLNAANEVAKLLFATENAVDGALADAGSLTAAMSNARRQANLAATVGQEAVEEVAAAVAAIAKARGHIVAAHRALDATKDQIGLRTVSFGTGAGKLGSEQGSLRVVGDHAA
jgi:flagellin-like hook-associated protein FlgL